MVASAINLGAENWRWDLSCFYSGLDDPQLEADIQALELAAPTFHQNFQGRLKDKLGAALADLIGIEQLSSKVLTYLTFRHHLDLGDAVIQAKLADASNRLSLACGKFLKFMDHEIVALDQADIDRQAAADPLVEKHRPYLQGIREEQPYLLSEPVEQALAIREPFGPDSWASFHEELQADLRFDHAGQELTLEEMLDLAYENSNPEIRAATLKTLNEGLKGVFANYAAQTLYQLAAAKRLEDKERGYKHPLEARNRENAVSDAMVEALHRAVADEGPALVKRFYRLKAAHLGLPRLRWSDRNVKIGQADGTKIPFDEAVRIVVDAYQAFSPTLAALVRQILVERHVDAPATPGKMGGAYEQSATLPGGRTVAFTLLNYLGSTRDVMTLAHELGHGVHDLLVSASQGTLMAEAPTAYCETASVFGEMLVFDDLRRQYAGDPRRLLALIMGKIDDIMTTVVRQIGFSNFEQRLHGTDRKLSVEELCAIWIEETKKLYGEAFTYENTDHLWAYLPHFHQPFYVYSYAFGELLTHSLFAVRGNFPPGEFESKYCDLLRNSSVEDAIGLLKPFGLDPADAKFWSQGLELSLGSLIAEAEKLSYLLGVSF
ncbi:MAG: M3 family metallopeptidase [Patescibacteria group bacterium]|jgi:oligoendopeptidase F